MMISILIVQSATMSSTKLFSNQTGWSFSTSKTQHSWLKPKRPSLLPQTWQSPAWRVSARSQIMFFRGTSVATARVWLTCSASLGSTSTMTPSLKMERTSWRLLNGTVSRISSTSSVNLSLLAVRQKFINNLISRSTSSSTLTRTWLAKIRDPVSQSLKIHFWWNLWLMSIFAV